VYTCLYSISCVPGPVFRGGSLPKPTVRLMKKPYVLIAVAVAGVLALPLIGYSLFSEPSAAPSAVFSQMAPAAGPETPDDQPVPVTHATPVEATPHDVMPSNNSLGLSGTPTTLTALDAEELPPLRIAPDQPTVIQLDRDAINILVGSNKTLRVVQDTNRTIVLIPKQPGSTYFRALDADGKVVMQRHVIIGAPKNDYIRIRRACVNAGDKACREYSVYYCPDMCHEVSVTQGDADASAPVPTDAPMYRPRTQPNATQNDGVDPNVDTTGTSPADTLQEPQ